MTFLDWGKDSKRSVWFLLKYLLIILWWLCMNILSSQERENGEKLWLNPNGGSRLAHDVPLRCHYCFVSFDASLLWYVLSNKPKSLKKRSSMGRLFISSSWRAFLSSFIRAQECFSTVSPQCRVPAARAVWIFCRPARSGEGVLRVSGLPESPRLRNPLPPCKVSCAAFVSCYFGVGDLLFFFFFLFTRSRYFYFSQVAHLSRENRPVVMLLKFGGRKQKCWQSSFWLIYCTLGKSLVLSLRN